MKNPFKKPSWSPYIAGAGVGIISWFAFLITHKVLATSTGFVRFSGFILSLFAQEHVEYNAYFSKYIRFKPVFEWQCMLLVGILIGAIVSSRMNKVSFSQIPFLWGKNFGFSTKIRALGAFIGGFLLLVGARIGGGCTLGHGVSGGLMLGTSSWFFIAVLFTTGIITANILYRKK